MIYDELYRIFYVVINSYSAVKNSDISGSIR